MNQSISAQALNYFVGKKREFSEMSKSVRFRESEDYSFGKKMLAKQAFRLVILTTVFGLLPVTWHGDRVTYSACSLSTLYSIVLLVNMIYLSLIFTSTTVGLPHTTSLLTATDMAVQVLRFTHVVGFLTLVMRGYRIAKSMPKIWDLLAILMQRSFRYPERWMKSQKIIGKYVRICILFFTTVILLKETIIVMVQRDDIVRDFVNYYGKITHGWEYWVVLFGYIIWDFTTLCHGLVSMLLTLFLVILDMCLKSINRDIKLLSQSCMLAAGRNTDGSHPNSIASIDGLEFDAYRQLEQEVNEIRGNYRHVEEILGKLSWSFGASVAIEQLIVTGTLISNLFFLYMDVFNTFRGCSTEYNYSSRVPMVDFVAHSFFFICLTSASSRVTKRSRKSVLVLKRIPTDLNSSAVQTLLREFLGDIATSRVLLTASDCFVVNKGLLQTVLSSVVTFTLVLVQFQYQERDFSGCHNPNSTLETPPQALHRNSVDD